MYKSLYCFLPILETIMPVMSVSNYQKINYNNKFDIASMITKKYQGFIKYSNFYDEKNYQAEIFIHWTLLNLLIEWFNEQIFDENNVDQLISVVLEKNIFNFMYYDKKAFNENVAINIVKAIKQNFVLWIFMFNTFIKNHGSYFKIKVKNKVVNLKVEVWNYQFS